MENVYAAVKDLQEQKIRALNPEPKVLNLNKENCFGEKKYHLHLCIIIFPLINYFFDIILII